MQEEEGQAAIMQREVWLANLRQWFVWYPEYTHSRWLKVIAASFGLEGKDAEQLYCDARDCNK